MRYFLNKLLIVNQTSFKNFFLLIMYSILVYNMWREMENFSYSVGCDRRGIMICLEYQSVCPFVRIGSTCPLSRKRECPPSLGTKGGGATLACGWGGGGSHSDDWRESLALCLLCGCDCVNAFTFWRKEDFLYVYSVKIQCTTAHACINPPYCYSTPFLPPG